MNIPVGINNKLHLAWKYACSDICPRKLTFLRSQKFSGSVAWGNCKLWRNCMQCTRTNIRSHFNAKWRLLLKELARQLFLFSKTSGDFSKPFLWIWRKMACRKSMAEFFQNVSEMFQNILSKINRRTSFFHFNDHLCLGQGVQCWNWKRKSTSRWRNLHELN